MFSVPFHQGVGRAARQLALPTLSPSHPGEGWEAGIPEDGCPNNGRGSSGQLGPCLPGQGLFLRPGPWEGDGSLRGVGCSPMEWSSFSRVIAPGASGSSQPRASVARAFDPGICQNKYADYSRRSNGPAGEGS